LLVSLAKNSFHFSLLNNLILDQSNKTGSFTVSNFGSKYASLSIIILSQQKTSGHYQADQDE
jgi:hypothetical protein